MADVGILVVSNTLSGAEKRFIRISEELMKKQQKLMLIINKELYHLAQKDKEMKVRIDNLEKNNSLTIFKNRKGNKYSKYIKTLLELKKIVKKHNISILHCVLGGFRYGMLKKFVKVKLIAEITSPDVADALTSREKVFLLPHYDKLIAVSEGVRQRTINSIQISKVNFPIEEVYCVSIPFFMPDESIEQVELKNKENLIVFACRFIERKHPLLFAETAKKLLEENTKWKVAILGSGPLEKEIKNNLKDLLSSKDERLIVEHTSDIYNYLTRSKIFVSLIYPDNYPSQSILEAMYTKNAILATDIGNTKRLVKDNVNGNLIKDFEVNSVYNSLLKAINDQVKLDEYGENSSKIVKNEFSKDIYLDELITLYESLK